MPAKLAQHMRAFSGTAMLFLAIQAGVYLYPFLFLLHGSYTLMAAFGAFILPRVIHT